jgi:CHASE2 domain-containing sensor protein
MVSTGTVSMPVFWLSSVLNLLIFLSWVVCGIGALHLKDWARQALRIVLSVYLINLLVNICLNVFLAQEMMSQVPVAFLVIGIVLAFSYYLGLVYFFSHPNVVRQFRFGVPPV